MYSKIKFVAVLVFLVTFLNSLKADDVSVRFACFGLNHDVNELDVYMNESDSIQVRIPRVGFSEIIDVGGRSLKIESGSLLSGTRSLEPAWLDIALPEEGGAFVILLMDVANQGIRPVVIPSDTDRFKAGDILFFNLSDSKVGVKLADESVVMNPYSKRVMTAPDVGKLESYQVQFFVDQESGAKIFGATRWQKQHKVRAYVFILRDVKSGRFTYKSMGEFVSDDS
ncbi:hypothetical protein QEH59_03665 [Coraliomargarita sp. SDUM461004]|uniref:Uncharacterized protein n=1 Tax=Thalassobacterium sedimentorum TaxID=3041258 RepID=A0ABU1AFR1_9BACT|nr:hypothetical protein [Coraliomargarita sp. SDUM461004]MDQ8193507.1 hypothetical protein [Coraliomargarita sp. SDUM461004]